MTYLADSRMVWDFEGAETMKGRERDQWVEEQGKLYEYSLKTGRNGQLRWTIDHTSKRGFDDQESLNVSWMNTGRVRSQFD
jgi:hypothetical protein